MKTVVELESELREEIRDVRERLRVIEAQPESDAADLEARLLGIDVVRIQGLVEELRVERERERVAMRRSLHRAGDHSLDDGDGDRHLAVWNTSDGRGGASINDA